MKWRKLAYALTGGVFTLILSFSWISWADNPPADNSITSESKINSNPVEASSKAGEISYLDYGNRKVIIFDGKQKHTYQLSEQTQVLINEQPADLQQIELGAHAEVIGNSAGDVRYLRVEQKAVQAVAHPQGMDSQSSIRSAETSSPIKQASTTQTTKLEQVNSFPWEEWKLDLHQGNVKVKLEWEEGNAEVEWKTSDQEVKLDGGQAKSFILNWYATSGIASQQEQKQIAYEILKSFDIQTDKPFTCTIEWKQDGESGKWTVHPKDQGKGKDKEKHKKDDDD